jgi:hypothetical protein
MSNSALKTKAEKRSKVGVWFNNLFRTKLEINTDKLLEMMQESNDNKMSGSSSYIYARGNLEKELVAKLSAPPQFITLKSLSVKYWCDVPKKLWLEFELDTVFVGQLHEKVNTLTDKLVNEWRKRLIARERECAEARGEGDEDRVNQRIADFGKDCDILAKECEVVAIETIAAFFTEKVQTYGDYKRYKVKAGAKLAFTFVGVIVSVVALSTAASPAAPATLVPAIIGLVSAAMSIGVQIANLAASAEEIEGEINEKLGGIEVSYKDSKGKPRKKTYKAREFGTGFLSGMTGGFSDVFIPSIKALLDATGLHKSKLDGLDVTLHEMGITANVMVDAMVDVDKVMTDNLTKLDRLDKAGKSSADLKKAQKALNAAMKTFESVNMSFLTLATEIPAMITRIETGRTSNKKLKEALEAINKALGTGGFALAGNILATLTMTGIGFAGGAPSNAIETATMGAGLAFTGADNIREYTPDVMEKIFGG